MLRNTRIAVIGAGLGGMTVAAFLQRAGFDARVYEQAPAFSRIGAGIILSPNVAKVLRRLDLEDMLIAAGIKADCYISRAWDTGESLYRIDFDAATEAKFGGPYLNVHRGDLHAILDRGLKRGSVSFNHKLHAIEETGGALRLIFDNGVKVDADIVIGADGLNSKVRESLFGAEPLRFFKSAALRTIFPASALNGFAIPDCTKWWGPDRHLLPYFLTSRRDEVYIIGVIPWESWDSELSFLPSSRAFLQESFAGFHDDLQKVIQAPTDVTLWPIFDRPRNDTWTKGRITLLGDACHPVPPYMGAGGAMAIEDGVILSRCLATYETAEEAFAAYQHIRVDRVSHVQRISWANSWMRGPTETDWFYCYDPCTAPLTPPEGPAQ
ncbi:FAD-dependent monooxygenase [Microbacteriaceae bacterium K1510]|nr:FAD-dependent monooxygenase [Microbacteriaceae bacterium K1510]